ncbi:hypothetical protein D3C77_499040 [compost metagenome]
MGRRHLGFRAQQIGSAQLHRRGAQGHGGNNAAMVTDAACRDHRHLHGIDHLGHERHRADLGVQVATEEHPAMTAGLIAHGDDRIATVLLQPAGFVNGGGAGQHLGPGSLDPLQQARLGQAEVKTDHGGLVLLDQLARGVIERRAVGHRRRRVEVGAKFFVVGFERLLPGRVTGRIGLGRQMAEKIDVERAIAGLPERFKFTADLLKAQGCAR